MVLRIVWKDIDSVALVTLVTSNIIMDWGSELIVTPERLIN